MVLEWNDWLCEMTWRVDMQFTWQRRRRLCDRCSRWARSWSFTVGNVLYECMVPYNRGSTRAKDTTQLSYLFSDGVTLSLMPHWDLARYLNPRLRSFNSCLTSQHSSKSFNYAFWFSPNYISGTLYSNCFCCILLFLKIMLKCFDLFTGD